MASTLAYEHQPDWGTTITSELTSDPTFANRGDAIAIDGDTALVGGLGYAEIYEWEQASEQWTLQQTIIEPRGVDDRFGAAVAIEGDTLVIGAPDHRRTENNPIGRVSIYYRDASNRWELQKNIISPNPNSENDLLFGSAVALSGDSLLVGAPGYSNASGGVFVFSRDEDGADNWGFVITQRPNIRRDNANFGASLAVDGDILIVGEPGGEANGGQRTGLIHVLKGPTVWSNAFGMTTLTRDPNATNQPRFGASVDIAADIVVVGEPYALDTAMQPTGRVSVYKYTDGVGLALLDTIDAVETAANQSFGARVSIDPSTRTIGVAAPDVSIDTVPGAVHLFHEQVTEDWSFGSSLSVQNSKAGFFARDVALDNKRILVGAAAPASADLRTGSLYGFTLDPNMINTWNATTTILGNDPTLEGVRQGSAVALAGDLLAVTSMPEEPSTIPPSVSIYERDATDPTKWVRARKFLESSFTGTGYGKQVALSGDFVFVSAPGSSDEVIAYKRDGNGWQRQPGTLPLVQDSRAMGDAMVAGDEWLVLGRDQAQNPTTFDTYLYDESAGTWEVGPTLPTPSGVTETSSFGKELAAYGPYLATFDDASERAFVFTLASDRASWQTREITLDTDGGNLTPVGVAIHDDTVAIAMVGSNMSSGEVHLYNHISYQDGEAPSVPSASPLFVGMDGSIALTENTLFVGEQEVSSLMVPAGQIRAFYQVEEGRWATREAILPPTQGFGYRFGTHLAAQNSELLVGAPFDSSYGEGAGLSMIIHAGLGCDDQTVFCTSNEYRCDMTEDIPRCEKNNTCGNSREDLGEECDDGNTVSGDGCEADCTLLVVPDCTEDSACDTGEICVMELCVAAGMCGNGRQETGEDCDDGNVEDGDACPSNCQDDTEPPPVDLTLTLASPEDEQTFLVGDTMEFRGTATAGAYIRFYIDIETSNDSFIGEADADANGEYSFVLEADRLAERELGTHELKVIAELEGATDEEITRIFHLLPDRGIQVGDKGVDGSDNEVNPGDTLSGYATPGKTIIVKLDGIEICRTTAGTDGYWECSLPSNISSGDVVVEDEDGNILGEFTISVVSGSERRRERADQEQSCGGCSSSGAPPASPLLLLFGFLFMRGLRRSRSVLRSLLRFKRRDLPRGVAILGAMLLLAGCSNPTKETSASESEMITREQAVGATEQASWDGEFSSTRELYARLGFRQFGTSVSVSGNTLAASTDRGVRLFERASNMDNWEETQQIYYATSAQEQFGAAIALSGDTLVVGAPEAENGGKIIIYERSATDPKHWVEAITFTNPNATQGDRFGQAVALHDDRIVVGAPGDGTDPMWIGKAHLFKESVPNGWAFEETIEQGDPGNLFGYAVALSDKWLAIGAIMESSSSIIAATGKVFLHEFDSNGRIFRDALEPTAGAGDGDLYGYAVALSDDTLFVSSPSADIPTLNAGMVYAYQNSGMGWGGEQLLDIHTTMPAPDATVDDYGFSLAFDEQNDMVYVGGPDTTIPKTGQKRGAVFAWTKDINGAWTFQNAQSYGLVADAHVGAALDVDNGNLVIGAPTHDYQFDTFEGEGLVISRNISADASISSEHIVGSIVQRDGQSNGSAVAISGDLLAVGAPNIGSSTPALGEVSIYRRLTGDPSKWRRVDTFVADSERTGFGTSLAWVGDVLLVSEPKDFSARLYVIAPDPNKPGSWLDPDRFNRPRNDAGDHAAISSDGNRVLLGDAFDQDSTTIEFFEYNASTGELDELPELTNTSNVSGTGFTERVSLSGNTAAVRLNRTPSQKSILLFEFDDAARSWRFTQRIDDPLTPEDIAFGTAFDLDGDLLAISSYRSTGIETGVVHIFRKNAATEQFELLATVSAPFGANTNPTGFGGTVALEGYTLFVASPNRSLEADHNSGRVFIFQPRDLDRLDDWRELGDLSPLETPGMQATRRSVEGRFGTAIATQFGEVVIGMPSDDIYGTNNGAAFVFSSGFGCTQAGDCGNNFICDTTEQRPRCEAERICGNGDTDIREESCDDGNTIAGDGCSPDCLIEAGFMGCTADSECAVGICSQSTCVNALECGNGRKEENETCDDGNLEPGDGCDANCALEDGANCTGDADCASGICNAVGAVPVCAPANTCGNSRQETGEECDDGNTLDNDLCLSNCQLPEELFLALDSPDEENPSFRKSDGVLVSGKTLPEATLTIYIGDELIEESSPTADGSFSINLSLEEGTYDLVITAWLTRGPSQMGESDTVTVHVLPDRGIQVGDKDVTDSDNEVRPGDLLSGYATPGKMIIIKLDGIEICRTTAGTDGYWECRLPDNISSGDVVVEDEDGNILGEFTISVVSGSERRRERADGARSCGGCSSSGAPPTSPLLLLFGFLFMRGLRRSRALLRSLLRFKRRDLPRGVAILGAMLLLAGCSNPVQEASSPEHETAESALSADHLPDWSVSSRRIFSSQPVFPDRGTSVAIDGDIAAVGGAGEVEIYRWEQATEQWSRVQAINELGGVEDRLGASVALDSGVLIIGAPGYRNIADKALGRVSIYYQQGANGEFRFHKSIEGPDSVIDPTTNFGASVAIAGDKLAVGAPTYFSNANRRTGRVFTYVRDRGGVDNWGRTPSSLVDATTTLDELYGASVALSPLGFLVIGAPNALDANTMKNTGAIYLYTFDSNTGDWVRSQGTFSVTPSPATTKTARFGESIAIAGNVIVVGSPGAENSGQSDAGAVEVFNYVSGTGLVPNQVANIDPSAPEPDQQFGAHVAIDPVSFKITVASPGLLTAGNSQGVIHIFEESMSGSRSWVPNGELTVQDAIVNQFAISAAIDDARILAGGFTGAMSGEQTGSLYGFQEKAGAPGSWTINTKILGGDQTFAGLRQGTALAMEGDILAITSTPDESSSWPSSVSIYERDPIDHSKWTRSRKFTDGTSGPSSFGAQVAISGDYVFVSSPDPTNSEIIAYKREGGTWSEQPGKLNLFQRGDNLGAAMVTGEDEWLAVAKGTGTDREIDIFIHQTTQDQWPQGSSPALPPNLDPSSSYGQKLVTSGPYLATFDDIGGRAVIYTWQSGGWALKTIDLDPNNTGLEPIDIAIHDDVLAVAMKENSNFPEVHIYDHVNFTPGQQPFILNNGMWFSFGTIALAEETLYVSETGAFISGHPGGQVSIYRREGGVWNRLADRTLYPPVERAGYDFGTNIIARSNELLISSPVDSSYGSEAGLSVLYQAGVGCDATNTCSSQHVCDMTEVIPRCEEVDTCGNGTQEAGEECDDGNNVGGDGCRANCTDGPTPTCMGDVDCGAGKICVEATCVEALVCGNGVQEPGEGCDDGNTSPGDGCDGICRAEDGGVCTEDTGCTSGVCNMLASAPVCAPANTCGNGKQETGEACDDGNLSPGDGCDENCATEESAMLFVNITSPSTADPFRPGQQITIEGEATSDAQLTLVRDESALASGIAGTDERFSLPYTIPSDTKAGPLELKVVAAQGANDKAEDTITLTIEVAGIQLGGKDVDEDGDNEVNPGDTLSGYATPGKTIIIKLDGIEICRTTAGTDGYWECSLPSNISSGDVVVEDEDGNILGEFTISVVSGGERERERADQEQSCGGCSSSGAPPASPLLLLFGFLFMRGLRRSRALWSRENVRERAKSRDQRSA
jgi:cysteine-rich repeat protein